MRMGSRKSRPTIDELDAQRKSFRRGLGIGTGMVLGAAGLAALFALTSPAKSAELPANGDLVATKVNLDQIKTYTVAEAGEVSKTSPNSGVLGQIVFHYDISMKPTYIHSLQNQLKKLRDNGYYAVAIPGGPKDSVQVIVAGKTADQLIFKGADILGRKPQDYGATLYQKLVGKPQSGPVQTAELNLEGL